VLAPFVAVVRTRAIRHTQVLAEFAASLQSDPSARRAAAGAAAPRSADWRDDGDADRVLDAAARAYAAGDYALSKDIYARADALKKGDFAAAARASKAAGGAGGGAAGGEFDDTDDDAGDDDDHDDNGPRMMKNHQLNGLSLDGRAAAAGEQAQRRRSIKPADVANDGQSGKKQKQSAMRKFVDYNKRNM